MSSTIDLPREVRRPVSSVGVWLAVCAAFVLAMIFVGGVTRLTRSGLSIVDWKPVTGVVPPLTEHDWQVELERYRLSPEGRLVNADIDVAGFQRIFWVEWAHRLLGRLTGMVVLLPLAYFLIRRRLSGARLWGVLGAFALGGVQGFLGWFMVRSGLVDRPHVSHFRLALHYMTALAILAWLAWMALEELRPRPEREATAPQPPPAFGRARALTLWTLGAVTLTHLWGALMAGLKAGTVAPTFPTMNGAWIPPGLLGEGLGALALLEGSVAVHFVHRALAYGSSALALGTVWAVWSVPVLGDSERKLRRLAQALLGLVVLQVALGAGTVLSHVSVAMASLHQLNGAFVFLAALGLWHALSPKARKARSVDVSQPTLGSPHLGQA